MATKSLQTAGRDIGGEIVFAKASRIVGALLALVVAVCGAERAECRPPNIVILLADDVGWGDVNCNWPETKIRTPNLDRMAEAGMRFTQFYAPAPVCSPTRAALLTGRYGARTGMYGVQQSVLGVTSTSGLPAREVTLAEALKKQGYATACVGKWHLGKRDAFWPTQHGFDEFFGILFANNQFIKVDGERVLRLYEGQQIVESNVDQARLTRRITDRAIGFMKRKKDQPFLLYVPYAAAHVPLYASSAFAGKSPAGPYGDVMEEMDWSVGQIRQAINDLGLARDTLVFFTSDNGPALSEGDAGGSAGPLRGGKGNGWEGSQRVPAIACWPGRIRAGAITQQVANCMDLFSTGLALAGAAPPADRPIDGRDIRPILFETATLPDTPFFFCFRGGRPIAVRKGAWKLHVAVRTSAGMTTLASPLLYNVVNDRAETTNVAAANPRIVKELEAAIKGFAYKPQAVSPLFDLVAP